MEQVVQLGVDRVICIMFGQGENRHHLIAELYAPGNIIVTDYLHNILCVMFPRSDPTTNMTVGQTYDVTKIRAHEPMTIDLLYSNLFTQLSLAKYGVTDPNEVIIPDVPDPSQPGTDASTSVGGKEKGKKGGKGKVKQEPVKKEKFKEKDRSIRTLLLPSVEYGGDIIDHCLSLAHIDPQTQLSFSPSSLPPRLRLEEEKKEKERKEAPDGKGAKEGKGQQSKKAKLAAGPQLVLDKEAPFLSQLCEQFLAV